MKGTKVMSQISTFEDIPLSISFFTANISDEDMIFYYSDYNRLVKGGHVGSWHKPADLLV